MLRESLNIMNQYMRHNNIEFELQGRVRKYIEYMSHKESNHIKENEILNKFTPALKKELIFEAYAKYLYQIPLFAKNFSPQLIEQLAFNIKELRFSPEEYIFHVVYSLFLSFKKN